MKPLAVESMAQTLFSIRELLEVMGDGFIPIMNKGAYLRFFLWVYINTREVSLELVKADLQTNSALWGSLSTMLNDDSLFKAGALSAEQSNFIFEAFLPFVTKLIQTHYNADICREAKASVTLLASVMSRFADKHLNRIGDHATLKTLCNCILTLVNMAPGTISQAVVDRVGASLTAQDAGVNMSDDQAAFREKYAVEMNINEDFDGFARLLQASYGGPNTLLVQLPYPVPSAVQTENYCHHKADDVLPLSPEFQAQLRIFVDYHMIKTEVRPRRPCFSPSIP